MAQNVGVASGAGVPPGVGGARESSTAATSSLDKTDNPRTSSQYKTALELELWKEEREKAFLLEVCPCLCMCVLLTLITGLSPHCS